MTFARCCGIFCISISGCSLQRSEWTSDSKSYSDYLFEPQLSYIMSETGYSLMG